MNATLAYEHLRGALAAGGKRKESLQLRLWNLNICIEKVEAKCWLAEMTLVMTSLPLDTCFQCLLVSRSFPLLADWRKSDSSVDREQQGNWRWNSNSRDAVASSPSFSHPAARAPWRACSQSKSTLLDVTRCIRLYTLLGVVLQSLKPIKRLETMLRIFASVCT